MFAAEQNIYSCLWDPALEKTLRLTGSAALERKSHLCQNMLSSPWSWNVTYTWNLQIASMKQLRITGWTSKRLIFAAQWMKSLFSSITGSKFVSLWGFLRLHPCVPLQDLFLLEEQDRSCVFVVEQREFTRLGSNKWFHLFKSQSPAVFWNNVRES